MKVFITGATGFLGRHLVEKLIADGHEVFCLVRNIKKFKKYNVNGDPIEGDLRNINWVKQLPDDVNVVIHTAGLLHSHRPLDFFQVNQQGTKNLIIKLRERYQKLKFIYISSLAAAGPNDEIYRPITEDDMPHPVSNYGKSKLAAEKILKKECPVGWESCIIRPPMVIGPGDEGMLEVFQIVNKGFEIYLGLNGDKKRYSFICVFDLVEVICQLMMKKTKKNELFYVSHPEIITSKWLMSEIKRVAGRKTFVIKIPNIILKSLGLINHFLAKKIKMKSHLTKDKLNELLAVSWCCDGSKASEVLDVHYSWDLASTVEMTYEDYKKRKWL